MSEATTSNMANLPEGTTAWQHNPKPYVCQKQPMTEKHDIVHSNRFKHIVSLSARALSNPCFSSFVRRLYKEIPKGNI